MNIYLTNHARVRNTNFCDEAGQVLYKSDTPGSCLSCNRTTKISKAAPYEKQAYEKQDDRSTTDGGSDHFDDLAAIEWHTLGSSVLTYGGLERPMKEFMPSKGIFAQHRVFTAPGDGRSFRWTLGTCTSSLVLDDGSKTPVAQSHRSNSGVLGKPRQARLEIFAGFEHLVDVILVGYVFVEKLRKERECAAKSGAAGGGGGGA
ncbi:hypothetical protein FIBSPDRAFT_1044321 [Athelia psychrophila]|uniref:DUF6593 domain-containing protein n=1 Tax=Athelia psychrophila TaxID=1759441 RepID=A0A166JS65_9AGAM|nr:hypothetical protein FIBSPDRAFT_1044321 [Fibularhizoctonia sp. CBS 109695]